MSRASEFLEEATRKDPNFVAAHAGLANTYITQGFYGMLLPQDAYQGAWAATLKTIQLDPLSPDGHVCLGRIRFSYEWDWAGAESEFKLGIELNPSNATAHAWYSYFLMAMGRFDEALRESRRALELDPLSMIVNSGHGWALYMARRYPEAIRQFEKTLDLEPDYLQALQGLADTYEKFGRPAEAFSHYQKWAAAGGISSKVLSEMQAAYAEGGMKGYWRKLLDLELEDVRQGNVWMYRLATLCARTGDKEQAFAWLERAHADRHDRMVLLKVDPVFDELRSEARFSDLLRRLKLLP